MSDPKNDAGASFKGSHHRPMRTYPKSSKKLGVLVTCIFAAGVMLCAWGAFELMRAHESSRWPSTTGIVTTSYVLKVQERKADHAMFSFYPKIEYRYTVLGQSYSAARIAFGGVTEASQHEAQKIVDQYPTDTTLTVHYDPNDPSVAVLKAGYRLPAYGMVGVGLVLCVIGIYFLRIHWRKRGRGHI